MKELTLEIDEKKYDFFMDLIRNFDFVSIRKEPSKKELLLSVAKGMYQASQASKGKIKSRNAKTFLNEL